MLRGLSLVVCLAVAGCGARSALLDDGAGSGGGSGAHASSTAESTSSSGIASSSSASSSASSSSSSASASSSSASSSSSSSSSSSASSSSSSSSSSSASSSSTGPLCHSDAECDDGVDCTDDVCDPAVGCVHAPVDARCDDGVLCTRDTCHADSGCRHVHTDVVCDDGIACTIDTCDAATDACAHDPCDAMCDDGDFCNGVERCDTAFGCTLGLPACDLGLACSVDTCDGAPAACAHAMSAACAPDVRLVVTTQSGALRAVSPYTGVVTNIAPSGNEVHLDIAILADRWFTIDGARLRELAPMTNQVVASFPAPSANSLGAGPDGMLYAASSVVYRLDPDTGAAATIGALPPGYASSGDIAFLAGRMYVSADGPCGGALVAFDTATGVSDVIGGDGLGCVYGLGATSDTLFILNCDGQIGTFDPATGDAHILSTTTLSVYGADVLP